jgi:hypothetical protein
LGTHCHHSDVADGRVSPRDADVEMKRNGTEKAI